MAVAESANGEAECTAGGGVISTILFLSLGGVFV